MRIAKAVVFAVGLTLSLGAIAAEKLDPALQAVNKEKFDDQAAAIRQQMKPGGRWEFVDAGERSRVNTRLDEIASLLATAASVDDLSRESKAQLVEAQEDVNAILTKKDGRRLICQQVAPTGSNRTQKQCATFAERERQRRDARDFLRQTGDDGISTR
ncbi:MAG: hypothetical protein JNN30_01605 [Rhodanobacteraceae bacterium]|nr:hypothetical protein [Rhodanobacteraceae bacterium]